MNTQLAFAFGMLVVVFIAMAIGITISLVKAYRLEKTIRDIIDSVNTTHRRIDEAERHVSIEIDRITSDIHRRIDETNRNFNNDDDELRRMIDSRFDKFENKIKGKSEPAEEKTKEKQLIKS